MKKEIIKQIKLTADEGMYLTNGEIFGKRVILPESADQNEWREITEEEYAEKLKEGEQNA